ncbi:MAG: hypothetical protein JW800_03145 [Candidatus Omnitrophica bacterium]|nr:hypothetical protein [Candidatus Omnitrophota bacterium]
MIDAIKDSILWKFFFVFSLIFLCGCMHQKESITIEKDGSGSVEVETLIPKATVDFVDNMMGGMMQGMMQMAEGMGAENAPLPKKSASEMMFANKEEIVKKANAAGVDIKFDYFNSEAKDDGLHVSYKYKFDDINRFLQSGLMSSNFALKKDEIGNLEGYLRTDESKSAQSKAQLEQFKREQTADQVEAPDDPTAKAMIEAMRDFKVEFYVTMPNELSDVTGVFKQKDAKTAYLEFSGDLLASPELIDQMYGLEGTVSSITCSADGLSFDITERREAEKELGGESTLSQGQYPAVAEEQKTILILNGGRTVEGDIVEENEKYIKIRVSSGIVFTYSREEISSIE